MAAPTQYQATQSVETGEGTDQASDTAVTGVGMKSAGADKSSLGVHEIALDVRMRV